MTVIVELLEEILERIMSVEEGTRACLVCRSGRYLWKEAILVTPGLDFCWKDKTHDFV